MLFSILSAGLMSLGLSVEPMMEPADSLSAATVTADKGVIVSRVDYLSAENARSISDLLNLSSGLHVGDNGGLRRLTLREGLRLCGYPDEIKFNVSEKDGFDLLGNTVVVPVIKAVSERLLDTLIL